MQAVKNIFQKIPKKILLGSGIGLLVIMIGGGYFVFGHLRPGSNAGEPTPPPVPQNVKSLIKDVEEKAALPPDEVPTIATVTDLSKLDQAFFLKAEKGDKVLMYLVSEQAYLYRPSNDQIINQGRLEIVTDETEASESAVLSASSSAKKSDASVLRVKL